MSTWFMNDRFKSKALLGHYISMRGNKKIRKVLKNIMDQFIFDTRSRYAKTVNLKICRFFSIGRLDHNLQFYASIGFFNAYPPFTNWYFINNDKRKLSKPLFIKKCPYKKQQNVQSSMYYFKQFFKLYQPGPIYWRNIKITDMYFKFRHFNLAYPI